MSWSPGVYAPAQLAEHRGQALIDTHIWVWLLAGDESRLPHRLRAPLERVRAKHGLLVSDASAWELAIKANAGRLKLSVPVSDFIERAERVPGVDFQPLDRNALVDAATLDQDPPADPFDRALIATARALGVPLITADREIVSYAKTSRRVAVCSYAGR